MPTDREVGALSIEQQFRHGPAGDEAVDQPTVHTFIDATQWSTKRYMNMRPLFQAEETQTEAAVA